MKNRGLAESIANHILENKELIDSGSLDYARVIRLIEDPYIRFFLGKHQGNQTTAAAEMLMSRMTLRSKLDYLGIDINKIDREPYSYELVSKLTNHYGLEYSEISRKMGASNPNASRSLYSQKAKKSCYHERLKGLVERMEASNDSQQRREA